MDDNKLMLSTLKAQLKYVVRSNGFVYHKPTLLLREHDNVLHIVNLNVRPMRVVIDYAMQPLYIRGSNVYLTCGARLDRFVNRTFRGWGLGDQNDFQRDCEEICLLLEHNVLPMFAEYGVPSGLIRFVEDGLWSSFTQGFSPDHRHLYAAYSHWYIGDIDAGISALSRVFDCGLDTSLPWVQPFLESQRELIQLAKESPISLQKRLNENIEITKSHIGLNK